MGDGKWLRRGRRRAPGGKHAGGKMQRKGGMLSSPLRRKMTLEHLEDRRMLVTYLVTVGTDIIDDETSFGSLRWAVEQSNATDVADEIVFDSNLTGIVLNGGQIDIESPLRILGPGPRKLSIFQTIANRRIFETNIGDEDEIFPVEISGVTLSGGNLTGTGEDQRGGAIKNIEALTMVETVVTGNSASQGGGGVFVERGSLTVDRSVFSNNAAGLFGGAILQGSDDEDVFPRVTITNSTITGNSASGSSDDFPMAPYGGGVFNRAGSLEIVSSTIVMNSVGPTGHGGGVAVWGAEPPEVEEPMEGEPPPEDPEPPDPTSLIRSSIVTDNWRIDDMVADIENVGMTDDDPPEPFLPLVESDGFNLIGRYGADLAAQPATDLPLNTDPMFVDQDVDVDGNRVYFLADFGGSTDVFMPQSTSPVIDVGDPDVFSTYEQRGRHFFRVFNYTGAQDPISDIGAVERQAVAFEVDELFDEPETEGQTAGVYRILDPVLGIIQILGYESPGDFTIREALAFARKNSDPSVISFSQVLRFREFEDDPNENVTPPTILLTLGPLTVAVETTIVGPTNFILEIDASGNDPTPNANDGLGTRVFQIQAPTTISDLTITGGDINNALGGGGLIAFADLTLIDMTFKDNYVAGSGGAVSVRGGTFNLSGTTFKNNIASVNGGGLYVNSGTAVVSNSTFSGNTASGRGGGIANENADLTIEYSTITLNTATTTRGSGVWTLNGANANTAIHGSIISGNSINDVEYATGASAKVVSLGYNLVGAGNALLIFDEPGDMPNVTNPMLLPLLITGGQTETHRPAPGSPIVDAGDPNFGGTPPFDQRGADFVREFDGDGDGDARIDIGAYELQSAEFVVSTDVDEADGNYDFGDLSLREAIQLANENPLFDRITFDAALVMMAPSFSLSAASLALNQTATMNITTSMHIEGPGFDQLSLDGSGLSHPLFPLQGPQRMFTISDGNAATTIDVTISGLSLLNAVSGVGGGAIFSDEELTLEGMLFTNNGTVFNPLLTGAAAEGLHGGAILQQGASLTINNSTLTGNYTNASNSDGGGIYAVDCVVNFFYTTISGNRTLMGSSEGGGVVLKNSSLVATEVSIVGNATLAGLSDGGGVYLNSSIALFEESAISGNSTAGSNSEGGGIAVFGAASQVGVEKNSTLSFNSTGGTQSPGGGAFVGGGTLTINNAAVIQNSTTGQGSSGGGVAIGVGGTLQMTSASVRLNHADGSNAHGGGVANLSGNVTIRNSTLSSNEAKHVGTAKGGGVYNDSNLAGTQTTTILNSTISGNSAAFRGGGVFNADGRTDVKHSTITNNSTPFFNAGNGVASQGNAATLTTVQSSIIAGNVGTAAGTGTDFDFLDAPFVNSFQSLGYNVVGVGNALATFNQTGDKNGILNPLLGPLASNGGLTQTHAVLAGSPAINAGNPAFNPNSFAPALTTDQRGVGFARVQGGRIDAGAFESSFSAFTADFDGNGAVDGADFLRWQRGLGKTNAVTSDGDANGDGVVNGLDLPPWRAQFGASASEAAAAPAATSGGNQSTPQLAVAPQPPAAKASASGDVAALASAGTPGSSNSQRPVYRPAVERRTTTSDDADSGRAAVFAAWTPAASTDDELLADAARLRFDAADDDGPCDESDEDAVFTWLGEAAF